MPTARWERPEQLLGYLEEEERVALEPLLGTPLYEHLLKEYERLRAALVDITSSTVKPTGEAKEDPATGYADVTERLERVQRNVCRQAYIPADEETIQVSDEDMATIRLLRICQQLEFYKMLAHKAGLLTVSFNEGGGMNVVSADGYESADDKRMERVVKDAWMSAGRAVDTLLLFLEADAKGSRQFTALWEGADAYYLHKDLLFQTARVLNEYLDIKSERMAYVQLVRDIRFCQRTYLMPRIGSKLLKAVVEYANQGFPELRSDDSSSSSSDAGSSSSSGTEPSEEVYDELLMMLRTALAFYVECRSTELAPARDKLARRDSMSDAQQAMAAACEYVAAHLDELGEAAVDTPIYNAVREEERRKEENTRNAEAAEERRRRQACRQHHKKLFTAFPATHRNPETK